jgi:hypothetical protein
MSETTGTLVRVRIRIRVRVRVSVRVTVRVRCSVSRVRLRHRSFLLLGLFGPPPPSYRVLLWFDKAYTDLREVLEAAISRLVIKNTKVLFV